ncbi:MAG TPA: iron ABC transporter permease, partial [bacterium]|nr:iron ABC transporter permease [bacterium]
MTHLKEYDRGHAVARYKRSRGVRVRGLAVLFALLALLCFISLGTGVYELSFFDVAGGFLRDGDDVVSVVLWGVRIPRTLSAVTTGFALGLAGALIQILLRNPLASPSTLGISHGAAFGAAFAIVVLQLGTSGGISAAGVGAVDPSPSLMYGITLCAFGGAAVVSAVILGLSRLRSINSQAIVLAGVALSSLFMSGTILIQYFASEVELSSIVFWTFGDVSRAELSETGLLAVITLPVFAYCMLGRWDLKAMGAGDESARMLGVRAKRVRTVGVVLAALVAAVATAFSGVIAFMGLIAPHIARRLVMNDHRFVIPYSGVIGALLLLGSDVMSRILFETTALPVGIITSFMGAPLFLYLLIK